MTTPTKTLVTGATGHIGSSTYLTLAEQPNRYDVFALDRTREFSQRLPQRNAHLAIPDDHFFESDLADYDAVRTAVEGMDVVVHLGADPGDDGSWESLRDNKMSSAPTTSSKPATPSAFHALSRPAVSWYRRATENKSHTAR